MFDKIVALQKLVYSFSPTKNEGTKEDLNLLGGKGANLAEMVILGIPVPPGFTLTTEVCTLFNELKGSYPQELISEVEAELKLVESEVGKIFGDAENPLLVSVRSGARKSMPGMMETILNVGLTTKTLQGMIEKTNNPRFVWDSYRRLIQMYADVVMEKAEGIEPMSGMGIRSMLQRALEELKEEKGIKNDHELSVEDLENLVTTYKTIIKQTLGKEFPDDPMEQLWGAIGAVFKSWNGKRAISYRKIENIPNDWGTAVNVQAMVFGNTGSDSATGVAFTRNPATGENQFFGEWLPNAQGEDVVAGIRTPFLLAEHMRNEDNAHLASLEKEMPAVYQQLFSIRNLLENHIKDMQDIEFTIEKGRLWMLQTRVGKRTGQAAIRMAMEMLAEKRISETDVFKRVTPNHVDELLHEQLDFLAEKTATQITKGLPAGPGGAAGRIALTPRMAEEMAADRTGNPVILVREETSPEDIDGMRSSAGILTAKGGMTSHAALVARGWGKCCIVGAADVQINMSARTISIDGLVKREGEWISLNGNKGIVYDGRVGMVKPDISGNESYQKLMELSDKHRRLGIRTNAETPEDVKKALEFGIDGIGLARTEHMFFGAERIIAVREMIMADIDADREKAVEKLLPFQRDDFYQIFKLLKGLPATIRLLDPPLHEFLPKTEKGLSNMMERTGKSRYDIEEKVKTLHESNPMLGNRGCRLGINFPMITRMQARAIFEAAAKVLKEGGQVAPEVMIPLPGTVGELKNQAILIHEMAQKVMAEEKVKIEYTVGTMIEIPRAAIIADQLVEAGAQFFSFGTNDLTQMTFGYSRDDSGSFIPIYVEKGILKKDPFQSVDQEGVGVLIAMAVEKAKKIDPNFKNGVCGEHGGDPDSIEFFNRVGTDTNGKAIGLSYISMSPFRVPVARYAAAQAQVLQNGNK